jgi:hypothetical protein
MRSRQSGLWESLRGLVRAWVGRDAIRSSPTDRVWLAVRPPCVILWRGERIEVLHRREIFTDQALIVSFECLTPRGRENLIVHPGSMHQPPRWEWSPD